MKLTFSNPLQNLSPSAIRETMKLTADPSVISLAGGNPSPDSFPVELIRSACSDILMNDHVTALQYGTSEGYTPLLNAINEKLLSKDNLRHENDEVLIVSGAQQGIHLIGKCLCNEGDTVVCENPSFVGALNSFRANGANLVGVEMDDEGIDIVKLTDIFEHQKNVRILYVIPNFQNPSGRTMSLARRKAVYELCKKHNVLIIEDNPYGELRYEGEAVPSIKSFDDCNLVAYCGSFSKILSPGLRVGYVVAQKELIAKMVAAKQCDDVNSTVLSQMLCYRFLAEIDYDAHINRICSLYRRKRDVMLASIKKHFPSDVTYTTPEGGLFIWCTLPKQIDVPAFTKDAVLNHKVAVIPGGGFEVSDEPTHAFRLNYSVPAEEQIEKGISILGSLITDLLK